MNNETVRGARATAYLSFMRIRFIGRLQYRLSGLSSMATSVFWGLVRAMFLSAFYLYSAQSGQEALSLTQAVGYLWIGQMVVSLQPYSGGGDLDIAASISGGNISYDLCRPIDLYWQWFFRQLGLRLSHVALESLPIWLISSFLMPVRFRLALPAPEAILPFLLSMASLLLLSVAFTNLTSILTIKSFGRDGINLLLSAGMFILSGITIPLAYFPAWAQRLADFMPFKGLLDTPARLYLGLETGHWLGQWGLQLLWTLLLILVGRLLLRRALRDIVIQGG